MARVKILHLLTLSIAFLSILPKMECEIRAAVISTITPRPLCASQFALVNYACAFLPPTTTFPPPIPPSLHRSLDGNGNGVADDHNEGHEHEHEHGHGHRRHRHQQHHPSARSDNCCRWAKQLDSQCVCEVLARLPGFLSRPAHDYTIAVSEFCSVTYTCGGPSIKD